MVAQLDKDYLAVSKSRSVRRFFSYLLFEGRPHTTKGQWFNPVVFTLLRVLAKIPRSKSLDKPIFIAGLGRSGTTVLGLIMSLHEQLGYLNEPKAPWSLIDEKTDTLDDYVSSHGKYLLTSSHVDARKKQLSGRIFGWYLALIRRARLLDKYPEHIFRISYLTEIFPDAKVIFITRSGNAAVASIAKWSQDNGLEQENDVEDWWGRNDAKWHYLCEQVLSQSQYLPKLSKTNLSELDHINRAALEWVVTMDAGIEASAAFPQNIISVSYEALLNDPANFFEKVFDFCELEPQQDVIDYAQTKIFQQRPKPFPSLMPEVAELFKETMAKLNYPLNSEIEGAP